MVKVDKGSRLVVTCELSAVHNELRRVLMHSIGLSSCSITWWLIATGRSSNIQ